MVQGLVDHYIRPPIADVMTLGEGLDLAVGPNACYEDAFCDRLPVYGDLASPDYPSLPCLLPLSGRSVRTAPLAGNVPWPSNVPMPAGRTGGLTAVVVQHRIDENREELGQTCVVDGHETIYENTLARHQYTCFLDDFAHDLPPRVRASGGEFTSCTAP
jgi:hypothetical protein